jgi:hypothetical protein
MVAPKVVPQGGFPPGFFPLGGPPREVLKGRSPTQLSTTGAPKWVPRRGSSKGVTKGIPSVITQVCSPRLFPQCGFSNVAPSGVTQAGSPKCVPQWGSAKRGLQGVYHNGCPQVCSPMGGSPKGFHQRGSPSFVL